MANVILEISKNAECYTFDNSGGMSHITYSIYVQYVANISSRVFGRANVTQKNQF